MRIRSTLLALSFLASVSTFAPAVHAQSRGDVAIVGFYTTSRAGTPTVTEYRDGFAFVTFVPLAAGTEIKFTDNGYRSSTSTFRTTEGQSIFTLTENVPAGRVLVFASMPPTIDEPGFSTDGDQLFLFTGTLVSGALTGELLYGLTMQPGGSWDADATSSNTSALPGDLVGHNIRLMGGRVPDAGLAASQNFAYSGIRTGTKSQLLEAIADPANWTGRSASEERPAYPGDFTVLDTSDPDGGVIVADASTEVDASVTPEDSGVAPSDSSVAPEVDAATPVDVRVVLDTSLPAVDARADSTTPATDVRVTDVVAPRDTAVTPRDTGTTSVVDSSSPALDSGTPPVTSIGRSGCQVSEPGHRVPAFAFLAAIALAFAVLSTKVRSLSRRG